MSMHKMISSVQFYETNFSLGLEDVKVKRVAAGSYHCVSLTGRP